MTSSRTRLGVLGEFTRRQPHAAGAAIVFLLLVLAAVAAPLITRFGPEEMMVIDRMQSPNATYLLGTDHFGRDMLARVVYGARISLRVGALVVVFTTIAGLVIGAIAGYYRRMDGILMRIMDAMMAFPSILLAIAIMSVLGRSEFNAVLALTIVYIPGIARLVRASVMSAKQLEFADAVRAMGGSDVRIIVRHVLPNILSPLVVQSTFIFVYAILAEAGLSFLGVGTPPSIPSWGNILSEGRQYMIDAPWIMLYPGLAVSLTVLCLNVIGDGLRDILDPRSAKGLPR